jgi:hypothetical protein
MKWLSLAIAVGACGESGPGGPAAVTDRDGAFQMDVGSIDAALRDDSRRFSTGDSSPEHDALSTVDADATGDAEGLSPRDARLVAPLTMEALQVAGTHNSYHRAPAVAFDASHKYTHLPLDQQLEGGVRAIELDLHLRTDGAFEIYHISVIDPNATCTTLDDCLGVVARWSDSHARHSPIFIWFELKDDTGGQAIDDLVAIETVISKVFGQGKLITPAWLKGAHASPHERIAAAGWPTIEEARGRVMFSIINRDARTRQYAHDFTSLDDRLMFVNAAPDQLGLSWASITKVDVGQTDDIARAHAAHLIVAANTCAINMSDGDCLTRLTGAVSNGIHMLHDDLPFAIAGRTYFLDLPGGSPGCNPVTAPPGCAPNLIE